MAVHLLGNNKRLLALKKKKMQKTNLLNNTKARNCWEDLQKWTSIQVCQSTTTYKFITNATSYHMEVYFRDVQSLFSR